MLGVHIVVLICYKIHNDAQKFVSHIVMCECAFLVK